MRNNYESMEAFAKEIEKMEATKNDFLAPSSKIRLAQDRVIEIEDDEHQYEVTDFAHGQIADKCQIPRKYYAKMAEIPGLRTLNVNAWLKEKGSERQLIRTLDNKIRAVLTDGFKPIDNYGILYVAILPALLPFKNDIQVKALSISETKMYIQFVIKSLQAEIKKGDIVQYGATVSNSEVGAGSANAESWIHRKVCDNGMVRASLFRKYHVGRRITEDDNADIWKSDTLQKELEGYQLRLRDVIQHALTKENFQKEVDKLKGAASDQITKVTETVENVTKRFGLTKTEGSDIIQNMVMSGDSTRWGLANGLTAMAHKFDNPDRQYHFEKIGSEIIDISPSDWKYLNVA